MITVLKKGTTDEQMQSLIDWLREQNLEVHVSRGSELTVLGLIGDTSHIDPDLIASLDMVDSCRRISEPYKKSSRKFRPDDTVIEIGSVDTDKVKIGGGHFAVIAGPCSVETEEQVLCVAKAVKAAGATLLRGGAFKPRTSPYDFQGLKADGIELLLKAKKITGMPIVTEIMNAAHLPLFEDVDVIQVGARNMQNFELLKALGKIDKPILLKRGLSATMKEFLMSAEYIMAGGNEKVILCERGIRTYETFTRNTLDLSAVPMMHELSHLPIIVDPSHATGVKTLVAPMAQAAVAAGCDGLMIEVHNDPPRALCDGAQSLTPEQFSDVMRRVTKIRDVVTTI
ncbi:MAG: 3-deoxy-7-phosphoheptulonate synthase [Clostridia bacterium]|nr:3-deoxy-7-phosphoheptulonate synthase [Clostridia bacterium]